MRFYHGSDSSIKIDRFQSTHNASDLQYLDGCENWEEYFLPDETLFSVSQMRSEAEKYAKCWLYEIEIDAGDAYQISSAEFMVSTDAEYVIVNAMRVHPSDYRMERIGGIR